MDGIILLHEIMHSLKQSKEAGMILKLDLSKAFDKLSWTYIQQMLIAFGLNFKCLSFYWNWNILEPSGGMKVVQVVLTKSLKEGWVSQNSSKRKGLLVALLGRCH